MKPIKHAKVQQFAMSGERPTNTYPPLLGKSNRQ
jgi:hypothetical protein